jgi:hypothetical protein
MNLELGDDKLIACTVGDIDGKKNGHDVITIV